MKCSVKFIVTFKVGVRYQIQVKRVNSFLINLIQNIQLTHRQVR